MVSRSLEILLWLFVIDLGITCGAGLYEHRIVLPQWFSGSRKTGLRVNSEAMRNSDVGRRFWAFVTTMLLTILTLASLVVCLFSHGALWSWWLTAAGFALIDRTLTFSFFIAKALTLMGTDSIPSSRTAAMALLWIRVNWVRLALDICGWLAALKALSLLHATSYSMSIGFGH